MESHSVLACIVLVVQGMWCLVSSQEVLYNLQEGDEVGRILGTIATDANLIDIVGVKDFANLRYSFLTIGSPHMHLFNLDENSSELTTKAEIDRESICEFTPTCEILLNVAAQSTVGSFFRKIVVQIIINDINDNAPVFEKPKINLSILESSLVGTSITIDGARDADTSDAYSLQSYEIMPSNTPFEIHFQKKLDGTSVVRLLVKEALNREVKDSYQFQVIARDGGSPPLNGTLQVNITIIDVNDNSPVFGQPSYNITVREDVNVSTVIFKLNATDADIGNNGDVRYRLSPHQEDAVLKLFAINSITGELSVKHPLTYNTPDEQYSIIIEASDRGDQPLTSQLFVHVRIQDVINSPPVINLNLLSGKVSEFANPGTAAAFIDVKDPDTGPNGEVSCYIDNLSFELNRLQKNEYKVTVRSSLNREEFPQVDVKITCTDNGSPSLSRSKSFVIDILDENDNAPKFEMPVYTAGILENNVVGAVIIHVKALDADDPKTDNGKVKYFLENNVMDKFSIESSSGILRALVPLDREDRDRYEIKVFAQDMGKPSLNGSAIVKVMVLDKNDNSPKFNQTHYTFELLENSGSGTKIGQLYATDADMGENAVIVYSGPGDVPFTVFPEGVIKSDKQLNREAKDRYDFTAEARDNGNLQIVHVTVFIKDENDNSPILTSPSQTNNTVYIGIKSNIDEVVTQIKAYDLDEGVNSELEYKVVGRNDSDKFDLNTRTGEITLVEPVTSDNGKKFTLNVLISDKGTPKRSTQGTLNIVVSSAVSAPANEAKPNNFIIVIVLVTVTIVASTAILFVIIFLRRKDHIEKSRKQTEMYGEKYDTSVTVFSLPSDDSDIFMDKKKKKEVSFSLEDADLQMTADPKQSTNKNTDITYDNDMQKKIDDSQSIGSTSDSGRGGSDDEIHSQRSPHASGTRSGHRGWYDYQRPTTNREMLTFGTAPSRSTKPYSSSRQLSQDNNLNIDSRFSHEDITEYREPMSPRHFSSFRQGSSESDRFIGGLNLSHDSISNDCVV